MTKYRVNLLNDSDAENPADTDEGFRIVSFNRRHSNFQHPEEFGLKVNEHGDCNFTNSEYADLAKDGHLFVLGYYEHGQCSWFLKGEGGPGTSCPWDGVSVAGLLILDRKSFEGTTDDQRAEAARSFLKIYTNWCNGAVYGYSIDKLNDDEEVEEHVDSCFGFYSSEDLFEAINENFTPEKDDEVEFAGEASWLSNYHDIKRKENVA